jgi:hypothetical protein
MLTRDILVIGGCGCGRGRGVFLLLPCAPSSTQQQCCDGMSPSLFFLFSFSSSDRDTPAQGPHAPSLSATAMHQYTPCNHDAPAQYPLSPHKFALPHAYAPDLRSRTHTCTHARSRLACLNACPVCLNTRLACPNAPPNASFSALCVPDLSLLTQFSLLHRSPLQVLPHEPARTST